MSSLLISYESDFKTTLEQAKASLAEAPSQPLSQRNTTLKHVEQQQDELFDLLDQMDVEVNNSIGDASERATYKAKLREWKKTIQSDIKRPLQSLVDSGDRDRLFGDLNASNIDDDQRQQLLSNHAILQIMMDLRSQRETLENARQTLFQADSYVDKSIKTLKTMTRRLVANKFISYAIIAVLILLILLVLFSKFK